MSRSSKDSIKFEFGRGLVLANAAGGDICLEIVFAADGDTGKPSKNGELADVIQHVGERTLEKFFGGGVKRLSASKIVIEALEGIEEALDFVGPGEGLRVVPSGLTFGHGEGPVKKVADVRENLDRRAAILARLEIDVALRGVTNDFASAIGDGGQGMAEKVASADGVRKRIHAKDKTSSLSAGRKGILFEHRGAG